MVPEICLPRGRTSNREAAVIKHMLIFHLLQKCSYTFRSLSLQPQLYFLEIQRRPRREALTLHSTHLGPQCHGLARAGGILWGTGHSHCMFPQKTCQQREPMNHLGDYEGDRRKHPMLTLPSFSLFGVEF